MHNTKPAIKDISNDGHKLHAYKLFLLAVSVGIVSGLGALVFRGLISFIFNLTFKGLPELSFHGSTIHIGHSIWGIGVILLPVLGAIIVTWLVNNYAPEAKGHGVPEVMYAIYYQKGKIRPIVAVIKAVASAICIGTGGSVGREGPIVQIGAAFGATLGQWISMTSEQRIILIAAGGAAGIAATFNAPMAGVTFAIELMLVYISALSIGLVTIAVVTAIIIVYLLIGNTPLFSLTVLSTEQSLDLLSPTILFCIPFGLMVGLLSTWFILLIYKLEDLFNRYIKNPYVRHGFGMFLVGILFYLFMIFFGHYYIEGIGYATIQDLLNNLILNPWLLFFLVIGKLVVTSLTLGSGGSGGVFSPSLFLGASFGALYGMVVNYFFPTINIDLTIFVLAGMTGMIGAATGAIITGILMIFEITQDYNCLLPTMITVAIAYVVRMYLSPESIYTMKFARKGYTLPQGLEAKFKK